MKPVRYDLCHPNLPGFSSLVLPVDNGKYVTYQDYVDLRTALSDMVFAYTNKQEDDMIPHDFEISAMREAVRFLEDSKFAKDVLDDLERKHR